MVVFSEGGVVAAGCEAKEVLLQQVAMRSTRCGWMRSEGLVAAVRRKVVDEEVKDDRRREVRGIKSGDIFLEFLSIGVGQGYAKGRLVNGKK